MQPTKGPTEDLSSSKVIQSVLRDLGQFPDPLGTPLSHLYTGRGGVRSRCPPPRAPLALTETLTSDRADPCRQTKHSLGELSHEEIVEGLCAQVGGITRLSYTGWSRHVKTMRGSMGGHPSSSVRGGWEEVTEAAEARAGGRGS